MAHVSNVLDVKGTRVHSVAPDATAYEAIEGMVTNNIGSALVMDGTTVIGIFSERDFLRRVTLAGKDPRATRVRDVMTQRVIVVEPHTGVPDCMAIMTQERIRHLPVVQDGRVIGVISIGDLVKFMSKEQEVEIRYLTEYIKGGA